RCGAARRARRRRASRASGGSARPPPAGAAGASMHWKRRVETEWAVHHHRARVVGPAIGLPLGTADSPETVARLDPRARDTEDRGAAERGFLALVLRGARGRAEAGVAGAAPLRHVEAQPFIEPAAVVRARDLAAENAQARTHGVGRRLVRDLEADARALG